MASNVVSFKVFLRSNGTTEARRFAIDDVSVLTSFLFINEKLRVVFPTLRGNVFKITWKGNYTFFLI